MASFVTEDGTVLNKTELLALTTTETAETIHTFTQDVHQVFPQTQGNATYELFCSAYGDVVRFQNQTKDPVSIAFVNPTGTFPRLRLGDLRTAIADGTLSDAANTTSTIGGTATATVSLVPGDNLLG